MGLPSKPVGIKKIPTSDYKTPFTDYSRWRLKDDHGRQTWHYLSEAEAKKWKQSTADKYFLGLDTEQPDLPPPRTPLDVARNGLAFFSKLQLPGGNWACDYSGPMFQLAGMVMCWYSTGIPFPEDWAIEIIRYLCNRAHPEDGGWGLHTEGESSVFGTTINYTTLRLLGMPADHPVAVKARQKLHDMGGALGVPHWGKAWLAMIGCFEWEGMNPIPPELWLLPDWIPLHPYRWWIHTRAVYLPMSYIWSKRHSRPLNDLTRALRAELFTQPYSSINFAAHRNTIRAEDIYHPHTLVLDLFNTACTFWSKYLLPNWLKKWAEDYVYSLVEREDENTLYVNLGPVNNPLQMLCRYIAEGPDSPAVLGHMDRLQDYLWVNEEGMLLNGTNGVQVWDTSFAVQSVVECGFSTQPEWRDMLSSAHLFLDDQQISLEISDEKQKCYRQQRKGAWAFSTRDQGYTVSDCTAEALKAVIQIQMTPGFPELVSNQRMRDAVDVMLALRNPSGGFASYEIIRGIKQLEWFNAAEVFGRIMIEYEYPECTTAVVTALVYFQKVDKIYRAEEIKQTIKNAVDWIITAQRKDGSWEGSWGICFSYAMMFALESLRLVGYNYESSERVRRACQFLVDKQMPDGGWGESYMSCVKGQWIDHEKSQVVNTSWALIALLQAGYPGKEVIKRGIDLLKSRQQKNGEWLQEGIEGVFNRSCMITYPNYKFTFPIKALGMYAAKYGDEKLW
ncbi:Lanosterol synthase (Oxidosqualene--lanosterol cyclase) [Arthrobotrys conoides]|uniref:Terpene cyclase/mutase family member n=1 Tax=Arthrobotrys conoides TaxID=74498 RepID=A0AAN8RVG9_9PEZI